MYLAFKTNWRNVYRTTLKIRTPLFGGPLVEDQMVAQQNRYKTSKMMEKSHMQNKCLKDLFENKNLPK